MKTAIALLMITAVAAPGLAHAEPYFAVRLGLKCSSCHMNPTGGGLRNRFGNIWGQTVLPERRVDTGEPWTGELGRFLSVGGNLRASANATDIPDQRTQSTFDVDDVRAFLELRAIPDRLSLYVDERIAPGSPLNRETYALLWFGEKRYYVKAGQMYLPYGWRLQDDTAFIRLVPGINYTTPDRGVELGFEAGQWTAQLAASNGTAGGPETDTGKQVSLRAEHVSAIWRAGASFNFNDADAGDRRMQNLFAGLRTGPVAWLAEADYIVDKSFAPERKLVAGFLEANWMFRRGHNLKITGEYFEPDRDVGEDQQNRFSVLWEYTPIQFVQVRVGARIYDGIPQNDLQNRRFFFAQLNGYF